MCFVQKNGYMYVIRRFKALTYLNALPFRLILEPPNEAYDMRHIRTVTKIVAVYIFPDVHDGVMLKGKGKKIEL